MDNGELTYEIIDKAIDEIKTNSKKPLAAGSVIIEFDVLTHLVDVIDRQKAEIKVKNKLLDIAEKKFKKYDAEIEELTYKLGSLLCHATGSKLSKHTYPLHIMESYVNDTIQDYCEEAKAEAIKEFAERLCEGRVSNDPVVIAVKCELKEKAGDNE